MAGVKRPRRPPTRMPLRYSKVSIPHALMERLGAIVEAHPELGYRSPTDAATRAIQKHVEELEARLGHGPSASHDPAALRAPGKSVNRARGKRGER